jgi:sigma-B regulation protein RsbU (phosphoserine phosphatase)
MDQPELEVLVVQESADGQRPLAPRDLLDALHAAGIHARVVGLDDLLDGGQSEGRGSLVLVPASVKPTEMDVIAAQVGAGPDAGSVIVFTDERVDALSPHIKAGRDYLLAPFETELLTRRIAAHLQRCEVVRANADLEIRAHLLRYERELQIAQQIQEGFLPDSLPSPDGWELEARFRPAREVAGDFYDGFELAHHRRIGFVVADVCDKGVGAALFMALVRTLVRYSAERHVPAHLIDPRSDSLLTVHTTGARRGVPEIGASALMNAVSETSAYILRNHMSQGYFATLFFGILDPTSGILTYINGGHNPPVLVSARGEQTLLKPTGPAVGMLPDVPFTMSHTSLGPGDLLFAYTDGVTEAKDEQGNFFTKERMGLVLDASATCATDLLDRMEWHLDQHIGEAPQFDDITMVVLRRQP